MKIKNLVAIFGLSLALGVGAAVGAVSNKAVEVKADAEPSYIRWDGSWVGDKSQTEKWPYTIVENEAEKTATVTYEGITGASYAGIGFWKGNVKDVNRVHFNVTNNGEAEVNIKLAIKDEGGKENSRAATKDGAYIYVYHHASDGGTTFTVAAGATAAMTFTYTGDVNNLEFQIDSLYGMTGTHSGSVTFSKLYFDQYEYSGSVTLDLTGDNWASASEGQKFSVYFWNDSDVNGWGNLVYTAKDEFLARVEFAFDFVPQKMIAVRYNPVVTEQSWAEDRWANKWGQTQNIDYVENANIIIDRKNEQDASFVGYAYIYGRNGEAEWAQLENLENVKKNGLNHVEYFIIKTVHTNDEFIIKMFNDGYGWRDGLFSDTIDAKKWEKVSDKNIKYIGTEDLTVAIYFDRNAGTVYITNPIYAAADEYAQHFLEATSVCDPDGEVNNITTQMWSVLKEDWGILEAHFPGAQAYIKAATAKEDGNYIEKCVARYEYIVNKYGSSTYEDFMDRIDAPAPGIVGQYETSSNNLIIIVSIIAATIVAITAGTIYLSKRKHD